MKQIAQYQDGRLELQEVPVPEPPPGGIRVRVEHSVISAGTERMKVEQAKMNLLQKARARPDQVRKVLDTARTLGWKAALEKVRNRLESPTPLGYSAAGVVESVDPLNTRFQVGDRVACAGAECAFHAEQIAVPDLLAVKIPDGVPTWKAAYATIASVGLHAVRQAEVQIGDRVLVLGQGLVGAFVVNLLAASGVRACAVDLLAEREATALALGAEIFCNPSRQDLDALVRDWTGGMGVDAALLCVAAGSNKPLEQAAASLRDRGRLVVVGNARADLDWKRFYEKELEVRYSRSYGPGRYDAAYEWGGMGYPVGYIPWTETRNLEACLELMRCGKLKVEAITTSRVPFAEAPRIYEELLQEPAKHLGVVLDYGERASLPEAEEPRSLLELPGGDGRRLATGVTELHAIGVGNFARTMLLPHLRGKIPFGLVANQTALSSRHVARKFGFREAVGGSGEVLAAGNDAAILIATRHHLHAPLVSEALAAEAQVFVEKPLCLTPDELNSIAELSSQHPAASVQIGFNRRFAPAANALRERFDSVPGPKSIRYAVHAGELRPDHWYANYSESGGRILGEACHFFDFFRWFLQDEPASVSAECIGEIGVQPAFPDRVVVQIRFRRGSVAQLLYTSDGDPAYPKETCEVTAAGVVGIIEDFQRVRVWHRRELTEGRYHSKGHAEQMKAWVAFLSGEAPHPLPLSDSIRSMQLTFAVLESVRSGATVRLV